LLEKIKSMMLYHIY